MVKKKTKSKTKRPVGASQPCISSAINNEVIAEALSSANQPVLLKVCRLCESKDGPFLNIFDPDKVTAKKIEDLMPFVITENDDLPHKICFRCSAKVVELHEFIQKCINTQDSLRKAIDKKGPVPIKTKTRKIWEEKLNKSNMSNDDICDALIKKAMESIKDIPLKPIPDEELIISNKPENNIKLASTKKEVHIGLEEVDENTTIKKIKLTLDERHTRSSRSKRTPVDSTLEKPTKTEAPSLISEKQKVIQQKKSEKLASSDSDSDSNKGTDVEEAKPINNISNITPTQPEKAKPQEPPPTFNIMDHVSKITVNGVGVLFQCKLCNRNFLKKDVVLSHDCAKKGKPSKVDFAKQIFQPEPPKVSTVKYIKMDADFRTSLVNDGKINVKSNSGLQNIQEDKKEQPIPEVKQPKPKVGPASKVKRKIDDLRSTIGMTVRHIQPIEPVMSAPPQPVFTPPQPILTPSQAILTPSQPILTPSQSFPLPTNFNTAMPSLSLPDLSSTSFKLVLGPNNTYSLVADKPANSETQTVIPETESKQKPSRKRKSDEATKPPLEEVKTRKHGESSKSLLKTSSPDVVDVDKMISSKPNSNQPYPVGLFQTVPHHSSMYVPPVPVENPTLTTPAMKKQSYKIVQTGNPSKLLISTKVQPVEETSKKRQRKSKQILKTDEEPNPPYSVTLEDTTQQKDSGFFTFINVDPLLQPSYVLPTDNIIQESQITTSTPAAKNVVDPKEKYSCNMCEEKFSREKKLLSHIQSHFSKMDQEDQEREKTNKRKGRK